MSRLFYNLAVLMALPFVGAAVLWRGLRDREWWRSWPERFGVGDPAVLRGALWVHAASVGEVQVAATLIDAWRGRAALQRLLITTATPAGRARARQLCPQAMVRLAPYDLPLFMRRAVQAVAPVALVIVETELWPNLLNSSACLGVPRLLVSARLSAASAARLARFPGLFAQAWRGELCVLAQTAADAERFARIGVPASCIAVTGSLKFDFDVPAPVRMAGRQLRAQLAPQRPLWVAGSTHPGEEAAALAAHAQVLAGHGDALLVIAPRHSRRFEEVAQLIGATGLRFVRRSRGESAAAAQVLLLDVIGELLSYYAAADLAFVGGSLAPVGGHNLLEPAALEVAIVTGPGQSNAPEIFARLLAAGGVRQVQDAGELARAVAQLLADEGARRALARAASEMLARERGALARTLAALSALLLRDRPAPASASAR